MWGKGGGGKIIYEQYSIYEERTTTLHIGKTISHYDLGMARLRFLPPLYIAFVQRLKFVAIYVTIRMQSFNSIDCIST